MPELLIRTAELRLDGQGRTIHGLAVPYGQEAEIREAGLTYRERFERGAFARSIRERGNKVKLLLSHESRRLPVGRATTLEERPEGLYAEFHVSATRDGEDALALVRDAVVDSFSVGFRPIRNRSEGDVTVRVEAALHEVSLVAFPAYDGALIGGVRTAGPRIAVDDARRRLTILRKAHL